MGEAGRCPRGASLEEPRAFCREVLLRPRHLGLTRVTEGRSGLCGVASRVLGVPVMLTEGSVRFKNTTAFFMSPVASGGEGKRLLTAIPHSVSYRKRKYFCFEALTCLLLVLRMYSVVLYFGFFLIFLLSQYFYSVFSRVFLVTASNPVAPLESPGSGAGGGPCSHSAALFFPLPCFWQELVWQPAIK